MKFKTIVLKNLIEMSHSARFVLVGDSGEADPEIYDAIASRFEDRIDSIYIRKVTSGNNILERFSESVRHKVVVF